MKQFTLPRIMTAFVLILLFSGCFKDNVRSVQTYTYTMLTPVFESRQVVLDNVTGHDPQPLEAPGKIYLYGHYLFVNEVNKGVHILDNIDPSAPRSVSFVPIPGNLDIAVKGSILYADMYEELLSIDISDPLNVKLRKSIPGVFPHRQFEFGYIHGSDPDKVLVDWVRKDTTLTMNISNGLWEGRAETFMFASANDAAGKAAAPPTGVAGSMARFSIVNNYLYTVNASDLGVFDISNPADPVGKGSTQIGWGIETIYPFAGKLFIGSNTGMFIYSISQPEAPEPLGSFSHAMACDPVVADDDYAFVTLRSGTTCARGSNQLDVLDIQDLMQPALLKTYTLTNPHGLGKDGNLLFICDGVDGLKVFDAADVMDLKLIARIDGMYAYDVIPYNKRLILSAKDGLYQYDYSDRNSIRLLSRLSVSKE